MILYIITGENERVHINHKICLYNNIKIHAIEDLIIV